MKKIFTISDLPLNYLKEAFFSKINISFLTLVSLGFFVLLTFPLFAPWVNQFINLPLPSLTFYLSYFFTALGLESILISAIANLPAFQEAVKRKYQSQVEVQEIVELFNRIQTIQFLNEEGLQRYLQFIQMKEEIEAQIATLYANSESLYDAIYTRLEHLDSIYLQTLLALSFQQDHETTSQEIHTIHSELETLNNQLTTTNHPQKRAFLKRRIQMLEKRKNTLQEILEQKDLFILKIQMIEDSLKYIKEKAQTLYSPTEYLTELDRIIEDSELHLDSVKEILSFFEPDIEMETDVDNQSSYTEQEMS